MGLPYHTGARPVPVNFFSSQAVEASMKKLTLNPEMLEVQSFTTSSDRPVRGTVRGQQELCTCYTNCTCPGCPTCDGYNTCDATCPATCANTCDDASCDTCFGQLSCGASCWETCERTCYTGRCICYQ